MRDQLVIVHQGQPAVVADTAQQHKEWLLPIELICVVDEPESSSIAIDERLNSLRADVEKILLVDIQRGGYATDTIITDPEYGPTDAGAKSGMVSVNVNVKFRTLYADPYSQ
jgi:hypothetical protein